jgi:MFS family permease
MNPGSWSSIILIYCYGVLASASISKLIPLSHVFARDFATGPTEFAFLVSLITLPAAIIGAAVGGVIDRFGTAQALVFSAILGALANILYLFADRMLAFEIIRVFEGLALVGIYASAPALIMATTTDKKRVRAMAFWATYTPVGFSTGLLLSGSASGTDYWRECFVIHALLFVTVASIGLVLPRTARAPAVVRLPTFASRFNAVLAAFLEPKLLRLVLALGCVVCIGFGTSVVFPTWFSRAHDLQIGAVSEMLALANLAMIVGSLTAGTLLARGLRARSLFAMLAAVGIFSGSILWLPVTPMMVAWGVLIVWLMTTGAAAATVMAVLPTVISSPQKGASAAGLISQTSALVTFFTPPIWFTAVADNHWALLIVLVIAGWLTSLILLPAGEERAASAPLLN